MSSLWEMSSGGLLVPVHCVFTNETDTIHVKFKPISQITNLPQQYSLSNIQHPLYLDHQFRVRTNSTHHQKTPLLTGTSGRTTDHSLRMGRHAIDVMSTE